MEVKSTAGLVGPAVSEPTRDQVDNFDGTLLLEFGAEWCPHCQALEPPLQALLQQHPEVQHWKIEDGKGKPLGRSFRVKLWPHLVLLRQGLQLGQWARPDQQQLKELSILLLDGG